MRTGSFTFRFFSLAPLIKSAHTFFSDFTLRLVSVIRIPQSWLPTEGNVRQLLCVDPCCHICESATLEIQQLLESDKSQISPALPELPQVSSCLDMLPISSVPFDDNTKFYSRHSTDFALVPVTQMPMEHSTQSVNAVGIQQVCDDHFQVGQEFDQSDMAMVSEAVASSSLRGSVVLVNAGQSMHSNLIYVQQNQGYHQSLNSQIPFQTLNPESTHVTHPVSLSVVNILPQPFLSPSVVRLLELHVKKLMHSQRWGLPRRVEESLSQLMPNPPMYFQPENNRPVSFILNNTSQDCGNRFGSISHQTWYSYTDSQPMQTFWVSEWSNVEPEQKTHCKQIPSPGRKPLFTPDHNVAHGICLQPEGQAKEPRDNFQKKFTQLFCGLPSMHSESLVTTFLGTRGLSKDSSRPSCEDPHLLKESSTLPLLPYTPPMAAPPPSSVFPNECLYEHKEAQITVPFLTLAECKTLEWHLLQRQLQLQWGLPAVIPGSPYMPSYIQYRPCNKAKPRETLKATWPGKCFSVLTRDLFFVPEHVRRLLEFHLQKQLIHIRWGLPQRIQRSIHLLLSSANEHALSCSRSRALSSVSIPKPGSPEADGSGDRFASAVDKGPILMPHLFVQAKAKLKIHVDSKCDQIHHDKVPACVQRSWEFCRCLSAGTPFPSVPPGQSLKPQAENKPDLHHKVVPQEPTSDQEERPVSCAFIEHCKRPQSLSEETIKKLETTLRHKYLAFLSGLPALYCVAPSRATSPAVGQFAVTEIVVKKPQKSLTQVTSLEDPRLSRLEPCPRDEDDIKASSPCPRDDIKASSPCPRDDIKASSPCPRDDIKASSPCPRDVIKASSPCPRDVIKASSPCPRDVIKASSPCPRDVIKASSPCPRDVIKASSPCPRDVIKASSPCPRDVIKASSPCPHDDIEMLHPCSRDDSEVSADITEEVQPEVQVEGKTEMVPLESQTPSPSSLNTELVARLSFHLKKKVLEIKLGIPITARELQEPNAVGSGTEHPQELVGSLSIPESIELQKLPDSGDLPPAPDASTDHRKKQPATAVQAVCHQRKKPSSKAVSQGSVHWNSKASQLRNVTKAQVPCVQTETSGEKPNLEEALSTEPHGPGKSKYSDHVPKLTGKSQEPGKPKAVGDFGEGDTGLGFSPTSEGTHHDEDQEPEEGPVHGTPEGSSQHSHSFHPEDPCPPSPQNTPELEFPDPPPEVFMEREPELDTQDSQTKANAIQEHARIAEVPQPVASWASQGIPFPRPLIQGKPFRVQTRQDRISRGQGRVMPTSPQASPSLPEAGLKNKVKSFLQSINPKIKGKTHVEPMVSTPATVAKTSKENVGKGLPQAKSPTQKTKAENCRGPKAQSAPAEKSVIASFLTAPHILDSKLRPNPGQHGSVSISGQSPRHCPRHCPKLAYATQHRNPP
ncbi:Transmembrane protein C9orf144B-like [Cricetulus griseus]|uniref:Transmembrane protein C9orf144B-like n=1 Tax=Cricetulus griseus TaxID=10029 RepID=G3HN18_CRIGR|nr:Transmembrane protein C9orf144B-like [Cricetulus griseus]